MNRSTNWIIGLFAIVLCILFGQFAEAGDGPTKDDCWAYSPASIGYQESFELLEEKLLTLDSSSAGQLLDEFIQCFMTNVTRSGDLINKNRGGSWGFLRGAANLRPLFSIALTDGVYLRLVTDDIYALWISRDPKFHFGSGIHIVKRDPDDVSTVRWHADIDSLTTIKYGMGIVPRGVNEEKAKENFSLMRAAKLLAADDGYRWKVLIEDFDIGDSPEPADMLNGPKAYHRVEEYHLDPAMFTNFGNLQVSNFYVMGWVFLRVGDSKDIHAVCLEDRITDSEESPWEEFTKEFEEKK